MNQKRFKKLLITMLLIPLVWIVAACSNGENENATPEADVESATNEANTESTDGVIQFTDSLGREITLEGPAETVITEQPSQAEIIYALGKEDAIIGRGSYVDYPENILDIPDVGSGTEINFEEIIQLDPDVLFIGLMGDAGKEFSQLEEAGITVIAVHATTIAEVYESIELIGMVMGTEDEAVSVIEEMESTFDKYAALADEQASEDEAPSVYFEISQLEYGLWTAGTETFMHEMAEMLNLDNTFNDIPGFGEISEEQVLDRDPDYIITSTMHYDGFDPVEEILNRSSWANISAVENKNVYMADADESTRPGPRLAQGIETLYNFIYGEE